MINTLVPLRVDLPSHEQTHAVLDGKECPYCGGKTEWVNSIEIYKVKSYGMIFLCNPCLAYVGVHHKTSKKALGRIANKELRQWKMSAHSHFDALWKGKMGMRNQAYEWLTQAMGIPRDRCHIGMFNVDQCKEVVRICNNSFSSIKPL